MSQPMSGPVNRPVTPTRVIGGRYVVLGELGRGGMGIVWRAEDRVIGRQVAVKELHLADGLSPEDRHNFRERLLREARTAGRLSDPGIVTVYDVVTDNGVDHIVMELIEARTLSEVVTANGPLDERAVASVAQQLLSALGAAHRAGVAHRDVKPGNVMLLPDGRVKLTDFGIAQATDDTRLTSTGLLVGSPGYLAPEQLDGADASPASDLWALGATLYFAVDGRGPFNRDTTAATIAAVLQAEIPPTRARGPLGSVIAGLLQRNPAVRLTGVQAAAILGSPATAPVQAGPPRGYGPTAPIAEPASPARRGARWPWLVAALVLGLVAGAGGAYALLAGTSQSAYTALSYGGGGDVPVLDVSQGYCYEVTPSPGHSVDGSSRNCDETHEIEVVAALDTYGSTFEVPYPGKESLAGYGQGACRMYFDSGVVGDDKDKLTMSVLVPSQQAFEANTASPGSSSPSYQSRSIYCVLRAADGSQLTGSRLVKQPGS
jgi:eukaryotic-like serine/threonine-protein kinase